jgi:hypothetical protein
MTKDNIFKNIISDPIMVERGYLKEDEVDDLSINDGGENKIIKIIKIAVSGVVDKDSETSISRYINQSLNS